MNAKETLEMIDKMKKRQVNDGMRVSFFLSKKTYEAFKKLCGQISVSGVVEQWMRDVLEENKEK